MKRILSYMGASLILVGLLQPIANIPEAPVAQADHKPSKVQVAKKEINKPHEVEVKVAEQTVIPEPTPEPVPIVIPLGHDQCIAWLQSVVSSDQLNAAIEVQGRENMGCDPQKYNMQGSDACGVAQELPCGKSGCGMPPNADGACQIKWMNSYVLGRYGSWFSALDHHNKFGWY